MIPERIRHRAARDARRLKNAIHARSGGSRSGASAERCAGRIRVGCAVVALGVIVGCGVGPQATTAPPPPTPSGSRAPVDVAERLLDGIRAIEPTAADRALFTDALAGSTWEIDTMETAEFAARRYRHLLEMSTALGALDVESLAAALVGAAAVREEALATAPLVPLPDDFRELEEGVADPDLAVSTYGDAMAAMLEPFGATVWIPQPGESTNRDNLVPAEPANEEDRTTLKTAILDTMREYGRLPQDLVVALPHTLVVADVVRPAADGEIAAGYVTWGADGRIFLVVDGWYTSGVADDGTPIRFPSGGSAALPHEMGHVFQYTFGGGPYDQAFDRLYPSDHLPSPDAAAELTEQLARQFEAADEVPSAPSRMTPDGTVITTLEALRGDPTLLPQDAEVVGPRNYNLYPGESISGFDYFVPPATENAFAVPPERATTLFAQMALRDARFAAGVSEASAEALLTGEFEDAARAIATRVSHAPETTNAEEALLGRAFEDIWETYGS